MSCPIWMQKPSLITEHNQLPMLPITLRGLKTIARNFRNDEPVIWRTTKFERLVVVARILQHEPNFIFCDNTDTLVHPYIRLPFGADDYYSHPFYRLIFEITSYSSNSLKLHSVRPVTPFDFSIHLTEVVHHGLQGHLH